MVEEPLSINEILNGETTFSDIREKSDDWSLYKFMNSGRAEPEIDHEEGEIRIDAWDSENKIDAKDEGPVYRIQGRSGLGYVMTPLDLLGDIPKSLGRRSARKNFGEKEAQVENGARKLLTAGAGAAILYDFTSEMTNMLPDMPESYVLPAIAGFETSFFLEGRTDAIKEEVADGYLDSLEEDIGNYTFDSMTAKTGYTQF